MKVLMSTEMKVGRGEREIVLWARPVALLHLDIAKVNLLGPTRTTLHATQIPGKVQEIAPEESQKHCKPKKNGIVYLIIPLFNSND